MDPGDRNISLETFNSWKVEALKDFLNKRGLSTDGTKVELAALCFAANAMNLPLKATDCEYVGQLQKDYNDLLCVDGKVLPDPLKMGSGWHDEKSGMSQWPPLFVSDIVNFLIDRGASTTVKSYMNDYKVGKAFEYCEANFIKEIFFHPISSTSPVCFLKAKCTPSQRLKDENHTIWVAISKEFGCVKSAFCSCAAGMGQTCNHVAALMFRVESANRLGITSCTSLPCQWKVPTATKVVPSKIKDLAIRKSRYGQEKTRPLVSKQKNQYKPLESINVDRDIFLEKLRIAVPNACLLKGTDVPKELPQNNGKNSDEPDAIEGYYLDTISKDYLTVEYFIDHQPTLTEKEVTFLQEKTIGQSSNTFWHNLRKGRITASKYYSIHTRMNSFRKNPEVDTSSVVSMVMGDTTPNSNIKALKFGRESEPMAKSIYCNVYKDQHINATFKDCGIFLHPGLSFLAASPDMLVSCDCCGEGLLEVKSTLKPKCSSCSSFCTCNLPDYLLAAATDGELEIKKNHRYFCQVQGQMAITKRMWCDFFVYSCNGTFNKRINFEEEYYADVQVNLIDFFKTFIAPKFMEKQDMLATPMEVESSGDTYFCLICKNQIHEQENVKSFGQRSICCDICNNWYHFKCVGMSKSVLSSTSTWLCQTCKTNDI
ncbi:uncharacterized protein LOC133183284 [Saccostrea echinata]|uniref:uncharacterized protein LOC133183284 n=1 Tax=Saccostrea echinata TaxID=191078 RepID=UPI002A82B0E6|nr:uncharacterized protein LOC133183284 [Saccostrea echinata]